MRGYPDPPLADPAAGIVLRPWRRAPGDAAALAAAWADPDVAAANPPPADAGEPAAARWIAGAADRAVAGVSVDLVVAPAGDDAAVWGEVGLHRTDPAARSGPRRAEIGWWIAAPVRGRGLAAAAAGLLAGWALAPGGGGLDQVFARISRGNPASAAVARHAGFRRLGEASGMAVWARTRASGGADGHMGQ